MKTIRIIDLLNMISKGEEVPKNVRYNDEIYDTETSNNLSLMIYETTGKMSDDGEVRLFLNDEVEIIEKCKEEPQEHKIPEKIEICYSPDIEEEIFYEKGNKPNHYVLGDAGTKLIINKINEILDYLEVNDE